MLEVDISLVIAIVLVLDALGRLNESAQILLDLEATVAVAGTIGHKIIVRVTLEVVLGVKISLLVIDTHLAGRRLSGGLGRFLGTNDGGRAFSLQVGVDDGGGGMVGPSALLEFVVVLSVANVSTQSLVGCHAKGAIVVL